MRDRESRKTAERSKAKVGIGREVKRRHFSAAETLFSESHRRRRSHTAERMALIAKEAIVMRISSSDKLTPIYLHGEGTAEEFGGILPGRSEARFRARRQHKQTTAKAPSSAHTLINTDTHRHPHLYTPEWGENTLSYFEVCLEWQAE